MGGLAKILASTKAKLNIADEMIISIFFLNGLW